jgi:hypothetical protein
VDKTIKQTKLKLQIIGLDDSENFPKPADLVQLLNQYQWKRLLSQYLPTFALEQTLKSKPYGGQIPTLSGLSSPGNHSYTCEISGRSCAYL